MRCGSQSTPVDATVSYTDVWRLYAQAQVKYPIQAAPKLATATASAPKINSAFPQYLNSMGTHEAGINRTAIECTQITIPQMNKIRPKAPRRLTCLRDFISSPPVGSDILGKLSLLNHVDSLTRTLQVNVATMINNTACTDAKYGA